MQGGATHLMEACQKAGYQACVHRCACAQMLAHLWGGCVPGGRVPCVGVCACAGARVRKGSRTCMGRVGGQELSRRAAGCGGADISGVVRVVSGGEA